MKRYKQILIGVSFIFALLLFIWGYNFLKGKNLLEKQIVYYAAYNNVSGLATSNPVLINGVRVGQVSRVYLNPDLSGNVMVMITLHQDFPIPGNTVAKIFSADLMGSKAIDLILGDSPTLVHSGDTLQSATEASLKEAVSAQVQPIKVKAEKLLSSIDSLVVAIHTVFTESAVENLTQSFNDIRKTFSHLESATSNIDTLVDSQSNRISSILANIDSITFTLNKSRGEIKNMIANLSTFSDTLAVTDISKTIDHANKSLEQLQFILTQINEGKGTLGMLMHNDTLYIEINKSAEELNKLLKDIRENPKRYVKFSLF